MKLVLLIMVCIVIISGAFLFPIFHGAKPFYTVEISSNFPFKINGTIYPAGNYYLTYRGIVNITFFNLFYQSNTSRIHLIGISFNRTLLNSSSQIVGIIKIYSGNNFTSAIVNTTGLYYTQIYPAYSRQYYVIVNAKYGAPITSGWYTAGETFTISPGTTYQNGSTRYIITHVYVNGTQRFSFTINSPLLIYVQYLTEYLVNFSKPTYVYINGSLEIISSQWLPNGTQLIIPKYINLTKDTRVFTTGNFTGVIYVYKPLIINDTQIFQYYVTVKEQPLLAEINGNYTNLTSNWYNAGTKIFIPPNFPLPNDYRIAIFGNVTGTFTVESPLIINDKEIIQYYVEFPFPLQVSLSNGTSFYGSGLWVDNGTIVTVNPQIHYINNLTRAVVMEQSFHSPNYDKLNYTLQYFVTSNLFLPVSINGNNVTLTSGWFNQSTNFYVYPIYYVNSTERIVILSTNYKNVTLFSPIAFNVYYIKEYLVTIIGYYSHSIILNEKIWEPYGSIVQIPLQYEYAGVYFQSNSSVYQYYIFNPTNITIYYYPITFTSTTPSPQIISGIPLEVLIIIVIIILISSLILLSMKKANIK